MLLVAPWDYHDERLGHGGGARDPIRSGPYSLLLLATVLKSKGHEVRLVDLQRELVRHGGVVERALGVLDAEIRSFMPEIIGFSFFSVQYSETDRAVQAARRACGSAGISPLFVAGGIHATLEPASSLAALGLDYIFVGEGEIGLARLADGARPEDVQGFYSQACTKITYGEPVDELDKLPFIDWGLCDHSFYSRPTKGRMKIRETSSLDVLLSRGCPYRCSFCAYGSVTRARYCSPDFAVEQIERLHRDYAVRDCYILDSSVGTNRGMLESMCESLIRKKTPARVRWMANMRANQIDRELLMLMRRAGCEFLFYGFESASQRILDMMDKGTSVDDNYRAALLHNELRFPYNASMILNYPGETEEDVMKTIEFLKRTAPPSIGINWFVPLPGSRDFDRLRAERALSFDKPEDWRRVGEVNLSKIYSSIPKGRCKELYKHVTDIAYRDIPRTAQIDWGRH